MVTTVIVTGFVSLINRPYARACDAILLTVAAAQNMSSLAGRNIIEIRNTESRCRTSETKPATAPISGCCV